MTDIRRSVLWGVFLVSLFLIYDAWNKHNGHPSIMTTLTQPRVAPSAPPSASGATNASGPGSVGAVGEIPGTAPAASTAPIQQVTLTTDVVRATFDSRGGSLVRLELLRQRDTPEGPWYQHISELMGVAQPLKDSNVVLFDRNGEHTYVAQSGVIDLPTPITHDTPMHVLPGPRELGDGQKELAISFASDDQGVKLIKTYTFHRDNYAIDVRHQLTNLGTTTVPAPQIYLQLKRDGAAAPGGTAFSHTFTGPAVYTNASKFSKIDFSDIDKHKASYDTTADNGWIAMVQHYFTSAWIHNPAIARTFDVAAIDLNDNGRAQRVYNIRMLFTLPALAAGASQTFDATLFAGPEEEIKLGEIAPGLELVKDYGWITIIAKPMFWLLSQLHRLIGNWGWSIVALVVILKAAFFGLNARAYRSMAKMKAVNPKIQAMRERLKDKPQQMQQEMMKIYKEEKINPLGGCLPIFIQMPFFIALYSVLSSSVEMRHAPWVGWITDLSAHDPFYILPVLMAGTSLLQAWLQPAPPDPAQARMMMLMPLIFSVMFFVFPAGLVLYWLTNNILSIAQQYVINKKLGVTK